MTRAERARAYWRRNVLIRVLGTLVQFTSGYIPVHPTVLRDMKAREREVNELLRDLWISTNAAAMPRRLKASRRERQR